MHSIGQNVLLIYPHLGIAFFQAEQGQLIFPCPRSRLRIGSRGTDSSVSSRVSLLVLHTQVESGAYPWNSSRFLRRRLKDSSNSTSQSLVPAESMLEVTRPLVCVWTKHMSEARPPACCPKSYRPL